MALMRPLFLLNRVVLLAAIAGMTTGFCSDQRIHAVVSHASAVPYDVHDPDVSGFRVRFAVQLTNRSTYPVHIPVEKARKDVRMPMEMLGLEAKQPDGKWAWLLQSTLIDPEGTRYAACRELPPSAVGKVAGVEIQVALMNTQVAKFGPQPTLRLTLEMACRQKNAKTIAEGARTEEFVLRLPKKPQVHNRDVPPGAL